MKIDEVDFFYLAMAQITTDGDGSQDALLVRVSAGGFVGWGECEASPLVSIAAYIAPMSHGACRPLAASVEGQTVDGPEDIGRIGRTIEWDSMDLLQAPHTWSGIEMALWDLLGKKRGEPVWEMLGYTKSHKKIPYASILFADTPDETLRRAKIAKKDKFTAAKFGWGPIGRGSVRDDADQFAAAREGLGSDGILLIDAGQIWRENVDEAAARLTSLENVSATWLEEPFHGEAYSAYSELSRRVPKIKLAGGESAHNVHMARHLIDYGNISFVQIDCGRIGGIGPAKSIADYAVAKKITYVNHTFTSHLALSASIQPYAGLRDHRMCEYPMAPKTLAMEIAKNPLPIDENGEIALHDAAGLGIEVNTAALAKYLVNVEIIVGGKPLFSSKAIS